MPSARERFLAFRKSLGRTPHLIRQGVKVRGATLAVYSTPPVEGAPPLVCVNGGMIHDHRLLWPALSPLAAARQLILFDQRGRGESPEPSDPRGWQIEEDAADLAALRRAMGLRQWDVLGHSWGGGISLLAASLDPAGVRRLVLVDAVGPTSSWMPAVRAASLASAEGDDRATLERLDDAALGTPDPAIHEAQARAAYRAWFADPEFARIFTPPRGTSATGAAVLAHLRREGYHWQERLRGLSVPTIVIHGEADALPASVAREIATLLPDARLELIPGAGHMPFWEQPERFFPIVERFLAPAGALR